MHIRACVRATLTLHMAVSDPCVAPFLGLQDFPYHLAAGITHFNLWANRPLSEREVQQHIARHVSWLGRFPGQ